MISPRTSHVYNTSSCHVLTSRTHADVSTTKQIDQQISKNKNKQNYTPFKQNDKHYIILHADIFLIFSLVQDLYNQDAINPFYTLTKTDIDKEPRTSRPALGCPWLVLEEQREPEEGQEPATGDLV